MSHPLFKWSLAVACAAALAGCGGGGSNTPAVNYTPSTSFAVTASGSVALMPTDTSTTLDPTTDTTVTSSVSGAKPYFVPKSGITVDGLKSLMNDATTFPRVENPVTVTIGSDTYKGYPLADVVVRATKFRPADYNTGAFGVTSVVIAANADAHYSVFSFTELVRSANGAKTIVAYEKNGAALPDSEGKMAVVAGNDTDPSLRKLPRLSALFVRNDYVPTTYTLSSGATAAAMLPADIAFTVSGDVNTPTLVTAATQSTTSTQGLYAVDMIGTKPVSSFPTYYFQEYGPRHMNFWYGQGIRLTDVLDTAGLKYPAEKNRCFVVVTSANNQSATFSCGELYNSQVGTGDGLSGVTQRGRSKGVLLVTDDFRQGGGNGVMMSCWNDLSTCTKTNAGDPTTYTVAMDANGDKLNYQSMALVSTEDKIPFTPAGRWYPLADCASMVWQCNPWIDVGERLQQNIKSMTVYYVSNPGSLIGTDPGTSVGAPGSVCSHEQVMAGQCVKSDGSSCSHLDYMAGTTCYLPPKP